MEQPDVPQMRVYDPRAALTRIRGGVRSASERDENEYYAKEPVFSQQPSRKGIVPTDTENAAPVPDPKRRAELERRVAVLEAENQSLAGENDALRRSNEEYAREREEAERATENAKEKYEAEIALLRDKVAYAEERCRKIQEAQRVDSKVRDVSPAKSDVLPKVIGYMITFRE